MQAASKRVQGSPKRSRTSSVASLAAQPPEIVLVGDRRRAIDVELALSQLSVATSRLPDLRSIPPDRNLMAIVLVAPLEEEVLAPAIRRIRNGRRGWDRLPVFAVVADHPPDRHVRGLYEAGATAVFDWPREALLLPRIVAEILAVEMVGGRNSRAADPLTRTLRARLRLLPWGASLVRVQSDQGVVQASGRIPTLHHKLELERFIAETPGVQSVDMQGVWVAPSALPDRQIAGAVRSVLRSTSSIDPSTLSIAVRNGHVVIAGSVEDRAEMDRILGVLAHVNGVRGIENDTVVSSSQKRIDRAKAERITRRLEASFPSEEVAIGVFGPTIVLSGRVDRLSIRRDIERLVREDRAVSNVINKMEIRS